MSEAQSRTGMALDGTKAALDGMSAAMNSNTANVSNRTAVVAQQHRSGCAWSAQPPPARFWPL